MTEPVVTAEMIAAARSAYTNPSNGTAEERWTRALLAALRLAPSPWRPIAEAPRDGTKFDAWQRGERVADVYWSDIQDAWCIDGLYGPEEPQPLSSPGPTHFQPLPQPPGDE